MTIAFCGMGWDLGSIRMEGSDESDVHYRDVRFPISLALPFQLSRLGLPRV
jgi:hypothetical protein